MIKVNEIRIGNLVTEEVLGIVPISSIWRDSVEVTIKHMGTNRLVTDREYRLSLSNIYPVPLTKEMLLKAGFGKNENWAEFHLNTRMGIRFYNFNYAECDIIQDGKFIAFKNSFIKYVHQLQNLYFALSGEELQIDLS